MEGKQFLEEMTLELLTRVSHLRPVSNNTVLRFITDPVLIGVHKKYSDILNNPLHERTVFAKSYAPGFAFILRLEILLYAAKESFGVLDGVNLLSLKLHMLHHIVQNLQKFGKIGYPDEFSSETFNVVTKKYPKMAFWGEGRTLKASVQAMKTS